MKRGSKKDIPENRDLRKTKLTLSITPEDKIKLKIIAAKKQKSISAMLHEWIENNVEEADV